MKKKLYRDHRWLLADSLETTIEVNGIEDIRKHIMSDPIFSRYVKNIHISKEPIEDDRIGDSWNPTYHVLADLDNHKSQCIGMCNFYEA